MRTTPVSFLSDHLTNTAVSVWTIPGQQTPEYANPPALIRSSLVTNARLSDRNAWLSRLLKAKSFYKRKADWSSTAVKAPQALGSRYYQLRLNKAPTAPYLVWTNRPVLVLLENNSSAQGHLFMRCAMWRREQDALWATIKEVTGSSVHRSGPDGAATASIDPIPARGAPATL
ncbi:hypothetical protein FN846DRAFT_903848 [Sphaerosporella brunnea]|uniref:Uncharacterized protein n=1 Tax=Sphaerosporella brunnea TaxID=1250544 RepID=A0A5J5F600_9PEZI|nr:hypothetical protein FN846DRAFT_903848 [Sphaerosporella brunnea]